MNGQVEILINELNQAMTPFGYQKVSSSSSIATWRRRSFIGQSALVLLDFPQNEDAFNFVHREKYRIGKELGYFPVFYALYLQIILVGNTTQELEGCVDKVDNQRCVLQSTHLINLLDGTSRSTRTWGQFISGPFHDAIEDSISVYQNKINK